MFRLQFFKILASIFLLCCLCSVFCTELWQKLVLVAKVEKFLGMAPPIAYTAVHPQQQQITQPLFRKVLLSYRVETNLKRTRKWFEMLKDFGCLRLLSSKDTIIFLLEIWKMFLHGLNSTFIQVFSLYSTKVCFLEEKMDFFLLSQ